MEFFNETSDWYLNNSDIDYADIQSTLPPTLPPELRFNNNALAAIIVYSALFVIAAVGNLTVFVTLCRNRHRKSRINLLIMHLAIADMVVTFIMIPLEVGWRATTQWLAGNAACKVFVFLRAFGLYLSSMVLVCVSLDRYFAILYPLRVNDARRRGKVMLICAWLVSLICSVPQSIVFHVSQHPEHKDYVQCVTFGFFSSQTEETAYNLFCVLVMYFIPLLVICFAYIRILWEISKKSKETKDDWSREGRYQGRMRLRRSDMSNIERARARTLRMTVIIVLVFIWCWTPYVVMTLWYMFDRESAILVDGRVQDALFIMAVSNSCMNPLVYGTYAMNFKQEFRKCLSCACFRRNNGQRNNLGWQGARPMQGVRRATPSLASQLTTAAVLRPGDPLCALSAVNSNINTRSTAIPGGAVVAAGHSGACNGRNNVVINMPPDVAPDFISYQMSGHSHCSESGDYSHASVAFYSEPLQCVDPEEDEEKDEEGGWWQQGARGRHRTAASARVRGSPSVERLERLRRWQGTTEVHRQPPTTLRCNSPRL